MRPVVHHVYIKYSDAFVAHVRLDAGRLSLGMCNLVEAMMDTARNEAGSPSRICST